MLDKRISEDTKRRLNASDDAGNFNKLLIDKHNLKDITELAGAARNLLYKYSKPWANEGTRILPNMLYTEFSNEFRGLKRDFDAAVDRFVAGYPQFIEDRKHSLKGAFNEEDYPDVSKIRNKFRLEVVVMPFPDVEDFRSDLDPKTVQDIREEIESTSNAVVNDAMTHTAEQITKIVGHMSAKLHEATVEDAKPRKKGEKRKFFTDTLVENVRELARLLPAFNLTNDPKLTRIVNRIEKELCVEEAQALRDYPDVREEVAKSADDIVAEVGKFFG
jgi:hypothetical protein